MDLERNALSEDAGLDTEPGAEGNEPTRQVRRSTSPSASSTTGGSQGRTEPAIDLSREALVNEEMGRVRVTVQVLLAIVALGLFLTLFMGGDPFAKWVFRVGLFGALVTMAVMLRAASDTSRYSIHLIGASSVALAVASTCAVYYIGVLSPAAMIGSLGLYIFCLGSSTYWAAALYGALAGGHALLGGLMTFDVIRDRGLIRATGTEFIDQFALHLCIQSVYSIAFLAGRASRRKLEGVFAELERAARKIAQRDALLNEAKRELERAAWVGGEGRFTEQVIGSFRLGNVIGRGGMGEVYEAVHLETQQEAAVKLLQRNVFADPNMLKRFAREAQAAASLDSPHVVRVLEIPSEDCPIPYLAMERLRGEDLGSMLRRERRLSTREIVKLLTHVGKGLDSARAVGVVHRDLKPQNLFCARTEEGPSVWKVLDFGVSKLVGHGTLTRDQLVGTPEYMAPEQAAGKEVDHRADLYGLAAVLYRCLVGRAPFIDESLPALVHKVVHQMPPKPSALARISSDVEAVLAIGLAKDPNDRFASGAALADAYAMASRLELPPELREKAAKIIAETPWFE